MELKPGQKKIKEYIISEIQNRFENWVDEPIWFTAPTGSGKTFIMSKAIDEILNDIKSNPKTAVLFFTLSQANLPSQTKDKFFDYCVRFKYEHIESPSTQQSKHSESDIRLVARANFVYIFGTSSVRRKTILFENNIFSGFIEDLTINKEAENKRILVVWDEAHIGSGQESKFNREIIPHIKKHFPKNYVILKMTATIPQKIKPTSIIKMTESQAIDDDLIKSEPKEIYDFKSQGPLNYEKMIDKALDRFKKLKTQYHEQEKTINPAALVQIGTKKTNDDKDQNWNKNLNILQHKIEDRGLTWCLWISKEKKLSPKLRKIKPTPSYLAKPDCEVDVIIFIYALATGWDIPRACMLLQLAELKSKQLTEQTIGRIRRNPTRPLQPIQDKVYDQYYLYTNLEQDQRYILKLKPCYYDTEFYTLKVNQQLLKKKTDARRVKKIKDYLQEHQPEILFQLKAYFRKLDYTETKRDIASWNEKYRVKTIKNQFELLEIWWNRVPSQKLRKLIETWTTNIKPQPIQVDYKDRSFPKITNWEWYLFWLNNKTFLKEVRSVWRNELELVNRQLSLPDLESPIKKTMGETGSEITQLKKRYSICIRKAWQPYFPYQSSVNPTEVYLDSATEKEQIWDWFQILKMWNDVNKISDLQLTCKNFIPLQICYELWRSELEKCSKQHPDLIVQFKHNQVVYTLMIEIKSLAKSKKSEYNLDEHDYETKIEDIQECYEKFAQKLKNKNYIFILQLTKEDYTHSLQWWYKEETKTATSIEEGLEQILKLISKQKTIN